MKLEEIGFYSLNDKRACSSNVSSPLYRCELILTDACQFKCPYCRGIKKRFAGSRTFEEAKKVIDLWSDENVKNIRISGGEPTLISFLPDLIKYIKLNCKDIEHIALSTNGFASYKLYEQLVNFGINDFSISLDACCASFGDKLAGNVKGAWEKVVDNIEKLSKLTYVTVGVVVLPETVNQLPDVIKFAHSLGVADIRIISAAQFNEVLDIAKNIPEEIINKHPILKFRINNIKNGINVRGLNENDSHKCGLVLDDMAIAGDSHFPCIIHFRESGIPIGKIGPDMRKEREEWYKNHDTFNDPVCIKNCLDVCKMHNNLHEKHYSG